MEQQKVDRRTAKEMKNAEIRKEEGTRKSLRGAKRRSDQKSSLPSSSKAGQEGIWRAAKHACRATAS
jgi:hypothetical protein